MSALTERARRAVARFEGTLTGRAALGTGANVIEYAARVGVTFFLNPILVAGLGSFGFGLWQRGPVDLSVAREGQPYEWHEDRWNHVVRESLGYKGPQIG